MLKQADWKFNATLSYVVRLRPVWTISGLASKTNKQTEMNSQKR